MNSLEFIEFYIKEYKRSVEWHKKYQEKNPTSFVNTLKEEELILHHLQQIKFELEAWEIVKRILDLTVKEDKQKYDFIYYWLIYHPYELLEIEKQDYEILKKALEVEDE